MRKIFKSRMLQKMLILAVLFGGLAFVITSNNNSTVNAARCCSECQELEEFCDQNSGCADCPYKTYDQCEAAQGIISCMSTCVFCSGGSETCEFDTQCPPGEFCVSGTCQSN